MNSNELLQALRKGIADSFEDYEQGAVYTMDEVKQRFNIERLEDIEDYNHAMENLAESKGETVSREEVLRYIEQETE